MKKVLFVLLAMLIATAGVFAQPSGKNIAPIKIELKDNFQYSDGYQGDLRAANFLNGHKITAGDRFKVKFSYSASRDLEEPVGFGFVDQTPTVNYWKALSWKDGDDMPEQAASKAGEWVTVEMTFTIINSASAASPAANTFVFTTKGAGKKGVANSGVKKAVTLTFREFTVTKL